MSEELGKGRDYNAYPHGDPDHMKPTYVPRPDGGFLEERLAKVEWDNISLQADTNNLNKAMGVDPVNMGTNCKACDELIMPIVGIAFPICDKCLSALGDIRKRKDSWFFKE